MFPDGRRVVSGSFDKTLKVWDIETGECMATLEGYSGGVRCGVHCTFVMIWLRRRSRALRCSRTGGASCLGCGTTRSSSGGCGTNCAPHQSKRPYGRDARRAVELGATEDILNFATTASSGCRNSTLTYSPAADEGSRAEMT